MDRPVIFLAFSNDLGQYLRMVNRERKNISQSLRWYHDNNVIKLEVEATTSLEDIFEVFTEYDNQVAIFHFGGHAGSSVLQLQALDGQTISANMQGLADLLGHQQNLKLVFLNGCATEGQVKFLLDRGIPAVIATSVAVDDHMATEFAELFYRTLAGHSTIERAFQIATAFIDSKYRNYGSAHIYRGIVLEDFVSLGKLPWGLYVNKGKEDVLNWTLPVPENTYESSNTENLLNRVPAPISGFVGYQKELEEFFDAFQHCRLIAVEGLGGVGKTEFSIHFIERYLPVKDRIIWLSPITKFDVMIQQAGYEEILRIENQEESLKFKSLEDLFDRDQRVIFIDDFHDNEDPTFLRFFGQLNIKQARVVIITRFLPEEIKAEAVIRLNGLGDDAITHARNLRKRNSTYEDITEEELEILCQLTEGHPLSMELGMQLLAYGETASDILHVISGREYTEHKKVEELSRRLLRSVLEHENTSPQERKVLMHFSIFRDAVPLEAIEFLLDHSRIKYPLSQLIQKSLIRYRNHLYDSPPLVREFCRLMLKDKIAIHERAADYFMDQRTGDFDIFLEENIIYHLSESNQWELLGDNIEKYGKLLITHGQTQLLEGILDQLDEQEVGQPVFDVFKANILIAKGELKKALQPAGNALEKYRRSEDLRGVTIALNIQGSVYSGLSRFEEAKKALQESLEIALSANFPSSATTAYEHLTYNYANTGKTKEALDTAKNGLSLAQETNDQYSIASMYNAMGNVYWRQGNFEEALEVRRKSFDIFSAIGARIQMVVVSNNIAVTLSDLKEFEKALTELENSLKIEKSIGAKYRIANLNNNIGKTLLLMGKKEEALKIFKACLKTHESIRYDFGKASAHHAIGLCLAQMDLHNQAIQSFKKGLEICRKTGYRIGEAKIYHEIGDVFLKIDSAAAIEWYLKAYSIQQETEFGGNEIIQKLDQLKKSLGVSRFNEKVEQCAANMPVSMQQRLNLRSLFEALS